MTVQLQVYKASTRDQGKIVRLLNEARRSFVAFGLEDLPHLLTRGNCMVAGADDRLWGFLCVALNGSGWAYLRGAAIVNGWRIDDALATVLEPLQERLSQRGATHLAAYGTALWLVPALQRAGFRQFEWIAMLERHPRPLALKAVADVRVRPVTAHDLGQLGALDKAAFAPPFQLESGELIELLVTSGHFAVAEVDGIDGLAGYVAADVTGDEGHIMRLAAHPALHGRGIGRMLLNDALAYCQKSDARLVSINTQDSNQASLRLYEGFGFRRVGRRVPLLVRELTETDGTD
ncbi:MAG: GNAT family N-acetyltransferase [Anaerolineae bacterium]|nr:GNAT family N-acetyltransferase [Anaerolineae bacterium]